LLDLSNSTHSILISHQDSFYHLIIYIFAELIGIFSFKNTCLLFLLIIIKRTVLVMLEIQRKRTYLCIFFLYFAIFFYLGIIPSNIDNLLTTLAGISNFGVSFIITAGLISGTVSLLLFGYFSDHLSQRFGRKNLFILTNLLWIITIGILSLSPHYSFFIVFYIIAAIGSGAFLPIGFSIIGDLFTSNERGKKFIFYP